MQKGDGMIRVYILGMLERFGPRHGYQIKSDISEQLADFTRIKLPVIYYHLEKMDADGLIRGTREKSGNRPEKTRYEVTEKGRAAFLEMLEGILDFEYRPSFPEDAAFYFSDRLEPAGLAEALDRHIRNLRGTLRELEKHREETMPCIPLDYRPMAGIIFSHHEHHYRAELEWAEESLSRLGAPARDNRDGRSL
jgi:DNA-binding PadR family transcriptional regulator